VTARTAGPRGVIEMKAAWLAKDPSGGRHRAKMIARSGFHALAVYDLDYCMATSAAHILEQWRSSGGVIAQNPATPYPDARYATKMMWWDRRTFHAYGDPELIDTIRREMNPAHHSTQPRRAPRDGRVDPGPLSGACLKPGPSTIPAITLLKAVFDAGGSWLGWMPISSRSLNRRGCRLRGGVGDREPAR
jgi:hypothetical protein